MSYETRPNGNGEPDWLPAPEEVISERARLSRLGVPRSLHAGAGAPLVAPGETPWLWWAAAALWVLLWPALIAGRAAGRWAFVPWAALLAFSVLHMLALAWPVAFTYLTGRFDVLRGRFGRVQTLAQMLALEPDEFEVWTSLLFQLQGFQVRNTRDTADHGIDLEVWNEQISRGLVQCKRYRGTVGEPAVRDLYGTMMHAHAERAWLVTTGAFSRQAREWAAGKPIDLWDGQTLVALAKRYR